MQWDFPSDDDGTRVKQVVSTFDPDTQAITGTTTTSYFMVGLYEETDGVARKYYAISGMTVAMSDSNGLKCLLTDHLGSVAAITDDQGTLLDQRRYLPFGAERPYVGCITQTDFGYTGQRDLPSMGLMDSKARAYDPKWLDALLLETRIKARRDRDPAALAELDARVAQPDARPALRLVAAPSKKPSSPGESDSLPPKELTHWESYPLPVSPRAVPLNPSIVFRNIC